jgi:hypothetical protein
MKILLDCEALRGYYFIEKKGFGSVKNLVQSFKDGSFLVKNIPQKLPENIEKEVFLAKDLPFLKQHTVIHEELQFDGIAYIYGESQYLMLYGSKLGHVYHYPDKKYNV